MRRVIASEFVSLDGVMESPEKWHFPYFNDEMGEEIRAAMAAADAMLLGRVTYEEWAAFWPTQSSDDEIVGYMNNIPKYVVSTSLDTVEWQNSTLIKGNVAEEITRLKQQPGKDILIFGSGDLVNMLVQHDLIDEYRIMLFSVVVGSGKRLFRDGSDTKALRLVETKTFGSGVVVLSYQPVETKGRYDRKREANELEVCEGTVLAPTSVTRPGAVRGR
jgi:dihydrofolate reductase